MMGIYSSSLVILVSGVWHASQWKPKWINVIKPHVIFQWFMCACFTPDGWLLIPCSVLYFQAPPDQNNKDFKTSSNLHSGRKQVSPQNHPYVVISFLHRVCFYKNPPLECFVKSQALTHFIFQSWKLR